MRRSFVIVVMLLMAVPFAFAQMGKPAAPKSDMSGCEAMMKKHEAMQKQMGEMDAKLQTLVGEMNGAQGSAKIDKMAAVITEIVAQRAAMQKQMAELQPEMMHHMMEHMQSGKGSMTGCPMMKEGAASAPHQHN
jgi:hypothetical protein